MSKFISGTIKELQNVICNEVNPYNGQKITYLKSVVTLEEGHCFSMNNIIEDYNEGDKINLYVNDNNEYGVINDKTLRNAKSSTIFYNVLSIFMLIVTIFLILTGYNVSKTTYLSSINTFFIVLSTLSGMFTTFFFFSSFASKKIEKQVKKILDETKSNNELYKRKTRIKESLLNGSLMSDS